MADKSIFENLDALRLNQDFAALAGTKEALLHVPVRKPSRHEFVRVQPDPTYCLDCGLYEDKAEREFYFVSPDMLSVLVGESRPVHLVTTLSRQGVLFLWPVPLPDPTGRQNAWHASAREAAQIAKINWIRIAADMSLGAYRVYEAEGELTEPDWPDKEFSELLTIGFQGRIIGNEDHAIFRRLRGLE